MRLTLRRRSVSGVSPKGICADRLLPVGSSRGSASRLRPSPSGGVGRRRATGPLNHVRYAEMR